MIADRSLAARAGRLLAARVSRRSFLTRTAVVGAALAAAPVRYALRPGTAWAAICGCNGSSCDCQAQCCDGWTEFCCTLTGENACPSGTVAAGWWKAEGSGFCREGGVDQPRYYLDCNAVCGNERPCECGLGDCGNRMTSCTDFRYGQCHQEVPCVSRLVCRVVSCTPPWEIDATCTQAVATSNATRFHHAACLEQGQVSMRDPLPPGLPIVGDWDGSGIDRPGVVAAGLWYLADTDGLITDKFRFGNPGDIPVVGDWDGDGVDTPGIVRDGVWYLSNRNRAGAADVVFTYGNPGDIPVAGDWDGDGVDTPGVVRGGVWYVKNANRAGAGEVVFGYGNPGDVPVVGDWDGSGADGPGVVRDGIWHVRDRIGTGVANRTFRYGDPGDLAVAGDWNGDGVDGPGVVRNGTWYLRNRSTSGTANRVIDP